MIVYYLGRQSHDVKKNLIILHQFLYLVMKYYMILYNEIFNGLTRSFLVIPVNVNSQLLTDTICKILSIFLVLPQIWWIFSSTYLLFHQVLPEWIAPLTSYRLTHARYVFILHLIMNFSFRFILRVVWFSPNFVFHIMQKYYCYKTNYVVFY